MEQTEQIEKTALTRAIEQSGGAAALARALGLRGLVITSQAISQWRHVPPRRVLDVEKISGVPRHELRPDLYPAPRRRKPKEA